MCPVSSAFLCSDLSSPVCSVVLSAQPSTKSHSNFNSSWKKADNSIVSEHDLQPFPIDMMERLNQTRPVWFLPNKSRESTTHCLRGRKKGNFIVRKSSLLDTYALTVLLSEDSRFVEHYLINVLPDNTVKLEGSQITFSSILLLVSHYCQCCDELPVKLCLPDALAQATTSTDLSLLAHLGEEFWESFSAQECVGNHTISEENAVSQENINQTTFKTLRTHCEKLAPEDPMLCRNVLSVKVPPSFSHGNMKNNYEGSSCNNSLSVTQESRTNIFFTPGLERENSSNIDLSNVELEVKHKKIRASHSLREDINDSNAVCFHSSLDDKVSDYEDLEKLDTCNSPSPSSNVDFENQKQQDSIILDIESQSTEDFGKELLFNCNQTHETTKVTSPNLQQEQPAERAVHSGSFKIQNTSTVITDMEYGDPSSPLYAVPVDAVNNEHVLERLETTQNSIISMPHPEKLKPQNCLRDSFMRNENGLSSISKTVLNGPEVFSQKHHSETQDPGQRSEEHINYFKHCKPKEGNVHFSSNVSNEELNIPEKPHISFKRLQCQEGWASDSSWEWCDLEEVKKEKQLQNTKSLCVASDFTKYEKLEGIKELEDKVTVLVDYDEIATFSKHWNQETCDSFFHPAQGTCIEKYNNEKKETSSCDTSHDTALLNSGRESNIDVQNQDLTNFLADDCVKRSCSVHTSGHVTTAPWNIHTPQDEVIRNYIFSLANDNSTFFAKKIDSFIKCTKESQQVNPEDYLKRIRQFMSGLSNFLVKNGEGKFVELIMQERGKLQANKFLNMDLIIEETLHELVIKPLKDDIYLILNHKYSRDNSLFSLREGIKYAKSKTPRELGIRKVLEPPGSGCLAVVKTYFKQMENEHSPLKKLENLLRAMSIVCNSVNDTGSTQRKEHTSIGADDFLPILVYVLSQCELTSAEIEFNYMWGLLHSSWHLGEGGYYLITLSSAVHALKQLYLESVKITRKPVHPLFTPLKQPEGETRLPSICDLQGYLKVMFPDEGSGDVLYKTLPVPPNMTTKEVCRMAASKFGVTNAQDYGLFKLVGDVEFKLIECECPQTVKAEAVACDKDISFIYRRCEGKFAWPYW
ncbi:uncharacterized protein LOC111085687 isoform X2 [Limulus polyphemus]|nr:uncharacterized protein LOC111085687 isoform X2 [Limulus polyphemus]